MQVQNNRAVSPLDRILRQSGSEKLKAEFLKLGRENTGKAAAYINHDELSFAVLYMLLPEIGELNLYEQLNLRNQVALTLCANILKDTNFAPGLKEQLFKKDEFIKAVLNWMFFTGVKSDGISDNYDQILDIGASYLIRVYQDTSILPELVHLAFRRNRKGRYTNDLVWVLFKSREPQILKLIADYLRSSNSKDVHLAAMLLNTPDANNAAGIPRRESYLSWYRENSPYLYFTGEGFHQTSDPVPCSVDLDAKYLCKKVHPKNGKLMSQASETEESHLHEFHRMQENERDLLARYSNRLHTSNAKQWNKWMEYPVEKQIKIARGGSGGTP